MGPPRQLLVLALLLAVLVPLHLQHAAAAEPPSSSSSSGTRIKRIRFRSHYPQMSDRPNTCEVAFRTEGYNFTYGPRAYIPFIGTSVVRDSQLLVLRLLYSFDFPVKTFVVVVPRSALEGGRVLSYEMRHLREYGTNILIIACEQPPSVSEGWNAVFHALPQEPWGIYNARDTAWEPGSLAKVAQQFWPMAEAGTADVALVKFTNLEPWPAEMAKFNVFMITRRLIQRFGFWDESIYPAFCEDDDFVYRLKLLNPPGVITTLSDVFVIHGPRKEKQYVSGTVLSSEDGHKDEEDRSSMTVRKGGVNCNYFLRKWGCPSEVHKQWVRSLHDQCKYKTPFNKSVPLWHWRTTKAQREADQHIELRHFDDAKRWELWDARTNTKIFDVPRYYGGWSYYEPSGVCRLTGELGRIQPPPEPTPPGPAPPAGGDAAAAAAAVPAHAPNCM